LIIFLAESVVSIWIVRGNASGTPDSLARNGSSNEACFSRAVAVRSSAVVRFVEIASFHLDAPDRATADGRCRGVGELKSLHKKLVRFD
jgi:hypothetical protein